VGLLSRESQFEFGYWHGVSALQRLPYCGSIPKSATLQLSWLVLPGGNGPVKKGEGR
jgi:hypothetical protein